MLAPTQQNDAFGYSIWADDESNVKSRFFYGFLGQFIIVIPEKNLIIVKTGFYNKLAVDEEKALTSQTFSGRDYQISC